MSLARRLRLIEFSNTEVISSNRTLIHPLGGCGIMFPQREKRILLGIGVVSILTFLYSVMIAQQILAWFGIVIPLLLLYLFWRFVQAHERIADAMESFSHGSEEPPSGN